MLLEIYSKSGYLVPPQFYGLFLYVISKRVPFTTAHFIIWCTFWHWRTALPSLRDFFFPFSLSRLHLFHFMGPQFECHWQGLLKLCWTIGVLGF